MASIISAGTTSGTALNMTADTTGALQLATGASATTAVTVDTSQNVGIGTTTPSSKLHLYGTGSTFRPIVEGTTNQVDMSIKNTSGQLYVGVDGSAGTTTGTAYGSYVYNNSNTPLVFYTNATERMRIDTSGNATITGSVSAATGSSGGFYSSTYSTNAVNNIWAFGNASNYGLKYFQGTSGSAISGGNADTIALPFGATTAANSFFQFVCNGSNIGALKMPSSPAFFGQLTTNGDQTFTSSTLPFNITTLNRGGGTHNTSSYYYTVPIAGYYLVYFSLYGTNSGGTATMQTQIRKNGTQISGSYNQGDTNIGGSSGQVAIAPLQGTAILNLAAGDQISLYASAYNGAALYRVYTGNSIFAVIFLG